MKFVAPVFMNDIITAHIEVIDFPKGSQVLLSTICKNQDQKNVIEGTALVMAPKDTVLIKKEVTESSTQL
jgi:acyl dehydratase